MWISILIDSFSNDFIDNSTINYAISTQFWFRYDFSFWFVVTSGFKSHRTPCGNGWRITASNEFFGVKVLDWIWCTPYLDILYMLMQLVSSFLQSFDLLSTYDSSLFLMTLELIFWFHWSNKYGYLFFWNIIKQGYSTIFSKWNNNFLYSLDCGVHKE